MIFKKNLTKNEYLVKSLEKEIKRSSRGRIPKDERLSLSRRFVNNLDLCSQHKSLAGYAQLIVDQYRKKQGVV